MGEANDTANRMIKTGEGKAPTLTLDPDEVKYDMSFMEPSLKENMLAEETKAAAAGAVDESMLSEDEKKQVETFVKQIDISNVKLVNSYGASAQKGISGFSVSITKNVKTKDFGDIGDSLRELETAIKSTTTSEKKGLLGLFKKGKQKVASLIANYESAETNIKKIEKDLQKHQMALTKDIFVFDQMYDMNLDFYKELTMYIIAGKKALGQAKSTKLVELQGKADTTRDQLDVQMYRDYADACTRFEKRLADLEMTRLLSIQMAPQIRLLQNADQEVVDKLRSDILNTIPAWRNQMVLALGIEHTTRALNAQNALDEMTNELFRKNAETLKQGAIDAALASERSIVDVETLKKINADIITSINEVVKIHEEGSQKRAEAQEELVKIETELKDALLKAGSR
ncbi:MULTISPECIES: toxic anion resistance protein [Clostridium]|uniref:toxic anion resistance protein n=1 Tax=Clostridium TaxID=1485 RepID=UPI000E4D6F59|nr:MULTISPECIES: toxic anion resistance protein [Clostridium]RHO09838.1 toxic anion resistance protein [Clostridium sp. AM18-55]